jgi:hypothetical protein
MLPVESRLDCFPPEMTFWRLLQKAMTELDELFIMRASIPECRPEE